MSTGRRRASGFFRRKRRPRLRTVPYRWDFHWMWPGAAYADPWRHGIIERNRYLWPDALARAAFWAGRTGALIILIDPDYHYKPFRVWPGQTWESLYDYAPSPIRMRR